MKAWWLLLIPVLAQAECVLQDRTLRRTETQISDRQQIRAEVISAGMGQRRCVVSFRARIGNGWYSAYGEYTWPGDRPREEACAIAMDRADSQARDQAVPSHTVSERVLVCSDRPDMNTLRQTNPGTVAKLAQFRPHPDRPNRFWHNGAQCRYFLDSQYTGSDIRTWEGIVCQLQGDEWVVVDKF